MSNNYSQHTTVLLHEAIQSLNLRSDGIYIDGTFGRGGHSHLILSKLGARGRLFAIDRDLEAIKSASSIKDPRFTIIHGRFSAMKNYMEQWKLLGKVDGILLDLGLSSPQLADPKRGFSFMRDGPLDMRMDTSCGQTAAQWLLQAKVKEIALVLKTLGEERYAKRISEFIVSRNRQKPIVGTHELATLIIRANPFSSWKKHPATRSFQAIRMFINNELREIEEALKGTLTILAPGGRLSVISFHSIEDRKVKQFINQFSNWPQIPISFPLTEKQVIQRYKNFRKFKALGKIRPSEQEIKNNPCARSSILRFAEKLI
ncbi:16S rRNA (cytosine(1402)-N(4))-methyltransferase RsmH [Sodalis sp. CWE]|uniref:16S rRNA (cytosine(1402)-N(4))-methyltransferase RsmH n=1 Tax=Sodalis sp. CWE TaxID=2803816 RepID=UPI001C7E056C|nr:16S rRNA (cytosine(1402)-N(4))-methyltransferase RsmH [Sodalis sp. CWE]MBX4180717.1 16S rRNA (cytosine(1402)-N(4))-methyltransferase RsmH [Sodalis sp. CWE]